MATSTTKTAASVAKQATAKKSTAKKSTAKKGGAKTPTAKKATAKASAATKKVAATKAAQTPTTKKASPKAPARRGALAAGAARAGGERAKRTATPLLSAAPAVPEAAAAKVPVTKAAAPAVPEAAAAKAPVTKAAAPAAKAPQAKALESKASEAATTQTTESAATGRTHRPQPRINSGVSPKAAAQAGSRRVPRQSPRQKRAADEAARAHLHAVPSPPATNPAHTPAATPAAKIAAPGMPAATDGKRALSVPTPTSTDISLPIPGVEEMISAAISLLRVAAGSLGISAEDMEHRIASGLAYLRRRIEGDYTVDEFGFDADFTEHIVFPILRPIYEKWFRVEVRGIENIPADGSALIVANHSGTVAIDSLMLQLAIHDDHPQHRVMRSLGADLVFQTPFLGTFARRAGSTLATNADADRLFANGELVGVFPEGFKGVGKPFSERYKLQRFGRGGFVSAALKAGVPIVPASIVGAEEIAPIIGNMKTVARLFGLPYAPITPTFPLLGPLGLIPLPSKWIIEFGPVIRTDEYGAKAAEDPMLVFDLTDQVRETIQQTLYSLLMQRRSVFF